MASLRAIALCAAMTALAACTHVVGFHPVKPPEEVDGRTAASVRLYMAPDVRNATHSFRSFGSGIANKWVVDYGARLHEYAVTYLPAAFTDFRELDAPAEPVGREILLTIKNVEYVVQGQAAHISLDAEAVDARGSKLLTKHYSTRGWSGAGAVLGGGAFAQKGVTRSSTDQALKEIFLGMIEDLRAVL